MNRIILLVCLMLPLNALADLRIKNAWIKQLPPPVPVRAGYMTIENPEGKAITIVGASSKAFGSVEIHRSVTKNNRVNMQPIDKLTIPAQKTIELGPNGTHFMLMQAKKPTKLGQKIPLTLVFADGRTQRVVLTVKK